MLIQFSVENFRSFKERATLSLLAAKIRAKDAQVDAANTFAASEDLTLLRAAAVYGANASGKTNMVRALAFLQFFVANSARETLGPAPIPVDPFRLSTETEDRPAAFEVVFRVDGQVYRYGCEITRSRVTAEWLFRAGARKEITLFIREGDAIRLGRSFAEGRGLDKRTRPNALFLSVVAQWNGPLAQTLVDWFQSLQIISGLEDLDYRAFTLHRFQDQASREAIVRFVRSLDVGVDGIRTRRVEKERLAASVPPEMRDLLAHSGEDWYAVETLHGKYDEKGQLSGQVIFDLESGESHGTQKLFFLSGPVLSALENGRVLVVDEMEARLHPLITLEIVRMFQSPQTNPHNAQLVFTTHDTNLLTNRRFRRDQIWFTEKDPRGATHLYSLAELQVRNDASFERDYIEGKYGAIPYLGDVRQVLPEEEE